MARRAGSESSAAESVEAVLMVGFPSEEVEDVRSNADALFGAGAPAVVVLGVGRSASASLALSEVLDAARGATEGPAAAGVEEGGALADGRVVLLCGLGVQQSGASLNDSLCQLGVAPAVVAAPLPRHADMPLRDVVAELRHAHARFHDLVQPMATGAPSMASAASAPAPGAAAAASWPSPPSAEERAALLDGASLVLNAVVDAGEVPSACVPGEYRLDEGHCVAVDGLCSSAEAAEILDWLTAPGHDHGGDPPTEKWTRECVDRVGDAATWGLRAEVLQALRDDPPDAILSVQRKLSALYPEWLVCHMPAEQLSDAADDDAQPLSAFVGNAVMAGDPCAYHVDADPTALPPASPWVHNYGFYHNREPGRPLFVSVVLYLNEWPEALHSETLVLDPESQTGLMVRPAPGRMLIMDQDIPHRISPPSAAARGAPRYSLVWKLVFFPREARPGGSTAGRLGGGGDAGGKAQPRGSTTGRLGGSGDGGEEGGGDVGGLGDAAYLLMPHALSLCRPEWGPPLRIGGAAPWAGRPLA